MALSVSQSSGSPRLPSSSNESTRPYSHPPSSLPSTLSHKRSRPVMYTSEATACETCLLRFSPSALTATDMPCTRTTHPSSRRSISLYHHLLAMCAQLLLNTAKKHHEDHGRYPAKDGFDFETGSHGHYKCWVVRLLHVRTGCGLAE